MSTSRAGASAPGDGWVPFPLAAVDLPPVTATNALLGLSALAAGLTLAWVVRRVVPVYLLWRGRGRSSATVFGRLTGWLVLALALSAALTLTFPSVKPVNVLGGVGVISIAAGIAFQTVLGNSFAGIVILARDRYRVGDQIAVGEYSGTVTLIELSSTSVRTFDGRLVLLPNGLLHSQAVTVQTGYEEVRSSIEVDLDENTDLDTAVRAALRAMANLPEVLADPAPEALFTEIGVGTLRLELRFWSGARQLDTREAQHAVIREVIAEFRAAGVATGDDVHVVDAGPTLARALERRPPAP